MAKEKRIIVGAINVRLQPHSTEKYISLLKAAEKLHRPIRLAGDTYAMLAFAIKAIDDGDDLGMLSGVIYKFSRIDPTAEWFNLDTMTFATADDKKSLVIPKNLRPNSDMFEYLFDPKTHTFFYEGYTNGKTLGHKYAETFVKRLFNEPELVKKFGKVDVTHLPTHDSVEQALMLHRKDTVSMVIVRPNPDDLAGVERRILKRMNDNRASVIEERLVAIDGESLVLDHEYVTLSRVAARNGKLEVKGRNAQGHRESISTVDHPLREDHYYNPEVEIKSNVMVDLAKNIIKRLLAEIRGHGE